MPLWLIVLAIAALVTAGSGAGARAAEPCQSANKCYFRQMPRFDQTDERIGTRWLPRGGWASVLCGPTSAAMLLEAMLRETRDTPTGWTASEFAGKAWTAQIAAMATLMGTDTSVGTYLSAVWPALSPRLAEFANAEGAASPWAPIANSRTYADRFHGEKKFGTLIAYGYYYARDRTVLGLTTRTYARNGGHFVALNGHSRDKLFIFNPWGGVRQWNSIRIVESGTKDGVQKILPYGDRASCIQCDDYWPQFIDQDYKIWIK